MIQSIKNAMSHSNTDTWHVSHTSTMQQHQDRLILLHHSRKCHHDDNGTPCPITQCAEAKRMWAHIAQCTDKMCSHCYLPRYVLTHYRNCEDGTCWICGPVREEIQRRKQQSGQRLKPLAATPNPMPKLTVAICRGPTNVGHIIPVRTRSMSSSSLSSLSSSSCWGSSASVRSTSNRSGVSGRPPRVRACRHPDCGGIKCRENLGIAHFCRDIKEEA